MTVVCLLGPGLVAAAALPAPTAPVAPVAPAVGSPDPAATRALPWGEGGHRMVAAVAADGLPPDVPAFFREAAPQLAWLNPEPDRWRDRDRRAMDEAFKYDHYIDLENIPAGALDASDRYEFIEALYGAGLSEPEQAAGFLPFRIVELYQRLENGFRRWRAATSPGERRWIEERIVNDAGILGHYVADASNPLHTTIHFNGWAENAPNPRGFTTDDDLHWRFESRFVDAQVSRADVASRVPAGARALADIREAVADYIAASHTFVVPLYELEQSHGFDPDRPAPATTTFAADRLAAGAEMLRAVWYSAWVNGGR